jgi:hypothetical protein
MLEALIGLKDWGELESFLRLARRHIAGLAVLGPCCDRAEAFVASARGNRAAASEALERALGGFESLHVYAEARATRGLLELDVQLSR